MIIQNLFLNLLSLFRFLILFLKYNMPVKITKQIVQPLLKNIPKPISITERLGIPKVLRSNPKVLEDPYY